MGQGILRRRHTARSRQLLPAAYLRGTRQSLMQPPILLRVSVGLMKSENGKQSLIRLSKSRQHVISRVLENGKERKALSCLLDP